MGKSAGPDWCRERVQGWTGDGKRVQGRTGDGKGCRAGLVTGKGVGLDW